MTSFMAEVFAILGIAIIAFMLWQLYRAKQYNRFLKWLSSDIKPQLIENIREELEQTRSEQFPNTEAHVEATILFYSQYRIRIFQAAFEREIISREWLAVPANKRLVQHLMHKEASFRL